MKTKNQTLEERKFIFKLTTFAILLVTSLVFNSCKKGEETDPKDAAIDQNEAKFEDNNAKEDDAEFLVTAATINLEEIELGKLAQTKASSQEVKDFGKMMVDGHTKSLNELNALAASKQVTLPQQVSDDAKETYKDLTEEGAKDFDKRYVTKMVNGHKDAISKFESAEKDTKDADVKAWVSKTLPDLHTHLEHAQALDEKIK